MFFSQLETFTTYFRDFNSHFCAIARLELTDPLSSIKIFLAENTKDDQSRKKNGGK